MGIKGLGGFLKWKVPNARRALRMPVYANHSWGIDISCLLYRARGAGLSPLTVIAHLLVRLRKADITPIVIFDGKPPSAKSEVVDQRRIARTAVNREMTVLRASLEEHPEKPESERADIETRMAALQKKAPSVSSEERDEIKQLLYATGVVFVTATGEADDLLAYLAANGQISAVISTDMDMLARGVPVLVVPETPDAMVLTEISLSAVLQGLGLNYEQFVDACQLMGSDYSVRGWRGVDPRTAVAMAAKGVDWTCVDVSGSVCMAMERGISMLQGRNVTWEMLLTEKQRARWAAVRIKEPSTLERLAVKDGWPRDWLVVLQR